MNNYVLMRRVGSIAAIKLVKARFVSTSNCLSICSRLLFQGDVITGKSRRIDVQLWRVSEKRIFWYGNCGDVWNIFTEFVKVRALVASLFLVELWRICDHLMNRCILCQTFVSTRDCFWLRRLLGFWVNVLSIRLRSIKFIRKKAGRNFGAHLNSIKPLCTRLRLACLLSVRIVVLKTALYRNDLQENHVGHE